MSEYQWVEFRAIESPLDSDAIEFMRMQSSRAEIDQWRFANEYNFGDFRGDWREMLRRGYDLHVHYSNFGNRTLCMRFPDGFEFSVQVTDYTDDQQIWWEADETGTGGLLVIEPEGDAGTFEPIWDAETLASDFVALWHMIRCGDMRPLYLAYLGLCCWEIVDRNVENEESEDYPDDEEPPVPPGLKQSHPSLDRLGEYLEVNGYLLEVAAEPSAVLQDTALGEQHLDDWIESLSKQELTETLKGILLSPNQEPQRTLRDLASQLFPPQSVSSSRRSSTELWRLANEKERRQREASEAEAARKKAERARVAQEQHEQQLQIIEKNPDATFRRIDAAVEERNRPAYRRAAAELKLVQEALGPIFARSKADELKNKYPSRLALHAEIRNALDG